MMNKTQFPFNFRNYFFSFQQFFNFANEAEKQAAYQKTITLLSRELRLVIGSEKTKATLTDARHQAASIHHIASSFCNPAMVDDETLPNVITDTRHFNYLT